MNRPSPLHLVPYQEFRGFCHTGYIGLTAGGGAIASIIQRRTNSPYSHAFMCGWESEGRVLMMSESTTPESRTVPLSPYIRKNSGLVDIYVLHPKIADSTDFARAWEFMLRAGGQDYPEAVLAHDWAVIAGLDPSHYPNSDDPETRRVCSQLLHAALRVAGMHPMVDYDCDAYPATFANPRFTHYFCTPIFE